MTAWRKSSYTTGSGGATECVEVARIAHSDDAREAKDAAPSSDGG